MNFLYHLIKLVLIIICKRKSIEIRIFYNSIVINTKIYLFHILIPSDLALKNDVKTNNSKQTS